MSNGATAGAAAAAAAIAEATKALGAIVRVEPNVFLLILSKAEKPLVVMAEGGIFKKDYRYLTAYKGLIFFARSFTPLQFSGDVELIAAKTIWIPS